jgi:predicted phage baseplate assembly protein
MPLPEPTLDNRRFDQLVGEGRALIPRLAPVWTDQNASDPGITLIELGAWLAEQNIYRFDRVSDEALRAFVRLCGIEPAMRGVARGVVSFVNTNAQGIALPARLQLADGARQPRFETTQPVFASPAALVGVASGSASPIDATAANAACLPFDPFGAQPRPGQALVLSFDRALDAAGATLALHVTTDHAAADFDTLARLQREHATLSAQAHGRCLPRDWRLHYRVRTVWEFHTGSGQWLPLDHVDDETRALTLSGFVRFSAPVGHQNEAAGGAFPIRCRIVHGRFECPPRIVHIGFNAVACEHALTTDETDVGRARGHALAIFDLGQAPVVAGSVSLRLDDGAGDVQTDWREAPDFERAGPFDRVFTLDPERGLIGSGDGLRAAILPAGHQVFARFRVGGGVAGNIEALTLAELPPSPRNLALAPTLSTLATPLAIAQPFAASGGTPRETLPVAQARAFDTVAEVDKAVTLADIERLALATPGVPVARVRAVAGLDARLPCWPAPGVVTVVVIPPCGRPVPMPSRALLDAVERWLDPRRLVTSEIHAVAPRYRRVGVAATLHLACEVDPAAVLRIASARFDAFLDPLTGGLDGNGWPFGRTVYRTEVMALLADVPGVASVTALSLLSGGNTASASGRGGCSGGCGGTCGGTCGTGCSTDNGSTNSTGRCDNIELCAHELVRPGGKQFLIESGTARKLKRSDAHECESV